MNTAQQADKSPLKQNPLTWGNLVDQSLKTAGDEGLDAQWVLDQIAAHGHPPWGIWRKLGIAFGYSIDWVNAQWNPAIEAQFPTLDEIFCQPIDLDDNN